MRRKDREMDRSFALDVADKCEYAVLSMVDPQGSPYCLPITIVRKDNDIYFHSAKEGLKIDALNHSPQVCMACVGDTCRLQDKFTTEFESAIIRGTAIHVTEDEEKIQALRLLCLRHTPGNMDAFDHSIAKSLFRTDVWKISIDEITGKRKKYGKDGQELKYGKME